MNTSEVIDSKAWFKALRWAMVLPSAILGFFIAFCIAFFGYRTLDAWCPGGHIISGSCTLAWVNMAPVVMGVSLAPSLVIFFGTLMAPSQRPKVAWIIYALGLLVALTYFRDVVRLTGPVAVIGAIVAGIMHLKFKTRGNGA